MKTPPKKLLASILGGIFFTAISAFAVPSFTLPPAPVAVTLRDGLSTTFTVQGVSSENKVLNYEWFKQGSASALVDGNGISGTTSRTLKITGAKSIHAGTYYAKVYEIFGTRPYPEASSPEFTLTVNVRPTIISQPSATTVNQGDRLQLSVDLAPDTTTTGLTFRWQKNNVDIPDAVNVTASQATFVIPAATAGNETTEGAQWTDGATYRVRIESSLTGPTPLKSLILLSKPAVVKVDSQPIIITQPAAATGGTLFVATKTTGKLSVVAGGNPKLNYLWEKEGVDETFKPSAAASQTVTTEGRYRVLVSNFLTPSGQPGTYSNYADVVFLNKPTEVGTITATSNKSPAQPNAKGEFEANEEGGATQVTLTVTPNLTGTGDLEFQWQKDGKNILNGDGVSGAQTAAIVFNPLSFTHRGVYRCVIKNKVGTYTSKTYALKVNSKPIIVSQPESLVYGVKDKSVTFSLVAGGTPALTYKWYREDDIVAGTVLGKAAKLTVAQLGDAKEDNYFCEVTNAYGSITAGPFALQVDTPVVITRHPEVTTPTVGTTLTLTIQTSQGDGPINYQWQRNNVNLENSPRVTGAQVTVTGPLGLQDAVSLSISDVELSDAGSYRCIVSNVNDTVKVTSKSAKVTVLTAPSIVTEPEDQEVFEDTKVTFKVVAAGSPTLKYQWQKWNADASAWNNVSKATSSILTIAKARVGVSASNSDDGLYRCEVSNATGIPAYSREAELIVNPIPNVTIDSITPRVARAGEKVRVTGTDMNFVTSVKFGSDATGVKATFVKESDTSLLLTVPPSAPLTPSEITIYTKPPGGQATEDPDLFRRSTVQANDRNNPTIIVGKTFPLTLGRTTIALEPGTLNVPATAGPNDLAEAFYTWVLPKKGRYVISFTTTFQVFAGPTLFSAVDNDEGGSFQLFSTVAEEDNTPISIVVFGVQGRSASIGGTLPDFGNYAVTVAYAGVDTLPSPVASAQQVSSIEADWNIEGSTGTVKKVTNADNHSSTSFTGNSSEGAAPTVLWQDASDLEYAADSVIQTEWNMSIDQAGAGTKGHFAWQVTGENGAPLGQIQFSVADGAIYVVQADGTRNAAEPVLVPGSNHRFGITTDLGSRTWQARMDGVALGEPQPLPANSGFGDVSVIWYPATSGSAQPTLNFDDVSIQAD
ncbi:immunoglobulin domain-containing protein [Prosthecobacter dejongeii]|uniref:Ig-like domain-containing protein n=1 Tax=Prosthecobacter dejongeii TaxID=48465 RepID=A0A7W7YLD5_9BACT|nr:immunoglobulin domain-containing protein [Prosthecobacter dejongeii]MBB5038363.1 hypothetical protein [Prosthecobacter dejongeii]